MFCISKFYNPTISPQNTSVKEDDNQSPAATCQQQHQHLLKRNHRKLTTPSTGRRGRGKNGRDGRRERDNGNNRPCNSNNNNSSSRPGRGRLSPGRMLKRHLITSAHQANITTKRTIPGLPISPTIRNRLMTTGTTVHPSLGPPQQPLPRRPPPRPRQPLHIHHLQFNPKWFLKELDLLRYFLQKMRPLLPRRPRKLPAGLRSRPSTDPNRRSDQPLPHRQYLNSPYKHKSKGRQVHTESGPTPPLLLEKCNLLQYCLRSRLPLRRR